MKQCNLVVYGISILAFLISPYIVFAGGSVHVKGHFRKDGTYVQPHYRSAPDSSFYNNWSTKGNFNPYTGEEGTVDSPPIKSGTGVPSQIYIPIFTGNSSSVSSSSQTNINLPSANVTPSIPENSYRSGNSWYCNSGYRRVGDKCVALNVPANAYVSGNAWYCNSGYRRVGDECRKLNVPENAYVSGNAWYCNSGYRRVGDKCVALNVPANAYVSGNAWYCNSGYRRVGDECRKLNVPENAYVSGNAWYCNSGYRRVGDKCVALNVPANAYVSGNAWYCNSGYRRVGDKCVALNVPANAYVSGNAWYCNSGYRRVSEECIKLKPGEEPKVIPSYAYRSYSYSVSGYGDDGYVYGDIDADCSRDVSGYLCLEDGKEVYFDGEWVGNGEVEGYDEDGNYYELEVSEYHGQGLMTEEITRSFSSPESGFHIDTRCRNDHMDMRMEVKVS